jgi:hypothetical protein
MDNQNCGQERSKRINPQALMNGLVCFEVTYHLEAKLSGVNIADRKYYKTSETMTGAQWFALIGIGEAYSG